MASVEVTFSVESDDKLVFSGSAYYSSETSKGENVYLGASELSRSAWMEVVPYFLSLSAYLAIFQAHL